MKEHIKEMQAAYGIEIGMFALQTKQEEHLKWRWTRLASHNKKGCRFRSTARFTSSLFNHSKRTPFFFL
ncbi:hypothetical protein PO124_12400 [Bacillus licheniformis]|nr:hypothetical protein [Bacillus licheniformis]